MDHSSSTQWGTSQDWRQNNDSAQECGKGAESQKVCQARKHKGSVTLGRDTVPRRKTGESLLSPNIKSNARALQEARKLPGPPRETPGL